MKIVISPAKSLNFESDLPTTRHTTSILLSEAKKVHAVIKTKTPKDLSALMSISDKLADLNWQRNQDWKTPFTTKNARPAIYTFDGDVYTGLDAYTIPVDKIDALQDKLRILSGLYGILKPLDLMQAYRLEMGIKLPIDDAKNIHEFWKPIVTNALNKELKKDELFVNLASKEYFSAVDEKLLKVPVITPDFKDYKEGKLKIISFYAKKARGMMVRYIIDTNAETVADLKGFNYDGYQFDANLSKDNHLIFTR
ncbi:peroxide stress protein YaaA [Flavobacterium sp. TMP13]|uniref:peroxide stress protein YaaA n=1 Tax=Flavobacterium sp. TMP13 TaxID=3425950 RepID=UPI003D76E46E